MVAPGPGLPGHSCWLRRKDTALLALLVALPATAARGDDDEDGEDDEKDDNEDDDDADAAAAAKRREVGAQRHLSSGGSAPLPVAWPAASSA